MAYKVKFLKSTTINGVRYEVGKSLSVSTSIYNRLIKGELAEDYKPEDKKTSKAQKQNTPKLEKTEEEK